MENRGAQYASQVAADLRSARIIPGTAGIQTKEIPMNQQPPKSPSFAKLKSGDWGVRIEGSAQRGQIVNVVTKAGKISPTKLGNKVWEGGGVQLYAIDKGDAQDVAI